MALGARGISVINASGDGGVRGNHDSLNQCTSNTFIPVFPASCPFVTSVGSTIGVQPERAINFTGGGFSAVFARPSYQATDVSAFLDTIPSNFPGVFSKTGRGYPDVSGYCDIKPRPGMIADLLVDRLPCKAGTSRLSPEARPVLSAARLRRRRVLRASSL